MKVILRIFKKLVKFGGRSPEFMKRFSLTSLFLCICYLSFAQIDTPVGPFDVDEDALNSTSVGTVTFSGGSSPDWSIVGGNDDGIFTINQTSGEITVLDNTNLNFEGTNSYTLTIHLDYLVVAVPASSEEDVVIDIIDVNDPPTASNFTVTPIYENTFYNFTTGEFGYDDEDTDPLAHVTIVSAPGEGSLWVDTDGLGDFNEAALTNGATVSFTDLEDGKLFYSNTNGNSSSFTFSVNDGAANSGTYTATLTVIAEPTVTLSGTASIAEDGGSTDITASLSHAFDKDVTVDLVFSPVAGTDFNVSSSSIVITAPNTSNTASITGISDADYEGDEDVLVDIDNVTNGSEDGPQQITITLTDNDPEINVQGNSVTIVDGDATPDVADETDFGIAEENVGNVDVVYTIQNTGAGALTLGGASVSLTGETTEFSVQSQPPSSVSVGESETFTIRFNPTSTGTKTATVNIANNDSDENPYTFDITGLGVTDNDAPVLNGLNNTPLFEVGGAPVQLDDDATISDAEFDAVPLFGDYSGAVLTIQRNGTPDVNDEFGFISQPNVSLVGNELQVVSTDAIAIFDHPGDGTLTITFQTENVSIPTTSLVAEVLQGISYENTSGTPPSSVQLDYEIDDQAPTDNLGTGSINVTINHIPSINNLDGGDNFTYTEEDAAQLVDGGNATITDGDNPANIGGAILTVSVSNNPVPAEDSVIVLAGGNITTPGGGIIEHSSTQVATYTGGTSGDDLEITFNTSADLAIASEVLQAIAYKNINTLNPDVNTRTLSFEYDDGLSSSSLATVDVSISDINEPPEINDLDGDDFTYNEDSGPVGIDQGTLASVFDYEIAGTAPDYDGFTMTISISNQVEPGEDELGVQDGGNVTVVGSDIRYSGVTVATFSGGGSGGGDLIITFNNAADEAEVNEVIQNITYENTEANNPVESIRTISFVFNDTEDNSLTADVDISVQGINDAPVITAGTVTLNTYLEDDLNNDGTLISDIIANLGSFTDPDGTSTQGIAIVAASTTNGTWQYTLDGSVWIPFSASTGSARLLASAADHAIRFLPGDDYFGTENSVITFHGWDQSSGSDGGTVDLSGGGGGTTAFSVLTEDGDITVDPVNDEPSFTPGALPTYMSSEGAVTVSSFATPDPGASNESGQTFTYTLDDNDNSSLFSVPPAIDASGELTFTIATNADGTANVDFIILDNGGTDDGGINSSDPPISFSIEIEDDQGPAVNDFSTDATPNDDADPVKPRTQVSFTLNEISTINTGNITLFNANGNNEVEIIDVTSGQVEIDGGAGTEVTITFSDIPTNNGDDINNWLRQGFDYYIELDEGVFVDGNGNLSPEIADATTWNWSMENDDNQPDPTNIETDNGLTTDVPLNTKLAITFDQPVRYTDSQNLYFRITNETDGDATVVDVNLRSSTAGETIQGFDIKGRTFDTLFVFDITQFEETFLPGKDYLVELHDNGRPKDGGGAGNDDENDEEDHWEETEDDDSRDNNDIFPFSFTTIGSVNFPMVESRYPEHNGANPDPTTLFHLGINFDQNLVKGSGNIELRKSSGDELVASWNVSDSDIELFGKDDTSDSLRINVNGITFDGNTDYYVTISPVAFYNSDNTGAAFAGFNSSGWNFTTEIEQVRPIIQSTNPVDNASNVSTSGPYSITFSENINRGTGLIRARTYPQGVVLTSIDVADDTDDGNGYVFINNNVVTFEFPDPLPGSNTVFFTVDSAFADNSGNNFFGVYNANTWNFLTAEGETIKPEIQSHSPNAGSGVSNQPAFELTFTEPIFSNSGYIYIHDNMDNPVESIDITTDVNINGLTVSFSLTNIDSLDYNTEYHFEWDAGVVTDAEENDILAYTDNDLAFTTLEDNFSPFIRSLNPPDDDTDVPLSPTITLEFSEVVEDQGSGEIYIRYTDGTIAYALDLDDFTLPSRTPQVDLSGGPSITLSGNTEYYLSVPSTAFEDENDLPFSGIAGNGNWSFTTDTDGQIPVPVVSPTATGISVSTDLVLTFPEPVSPNTGSITIEYTDGTDVEVIPVSSGVASLGRTVYTYELSKDLSGGVTYHINVDDEAFVDNTGNPTSEIIGSTDWSFTTGDDGTAPAIISLTPANDLNGVPTTSNSLVLTFNEPVVKTGNGNITLRYSDGTSIQPFASGNVTLSNGNTVATTSAYGTLDGLTEYYVEVDAGFFEDFDDPNNSFAGISSDGSWSFITAADGAPPIIGAVTPGDGSPGNPVDPTLTIPFSERVYAGTGTITLVGGTSSHTITVNVLDGTQVSGLGSNTISVTPTESLNNGETYTVTVSAGAFKDPSNNTNSQFIWSFMVGDATVVTNSNTVICTNQDYVGLGDLVIAETTNTDFVPGLGQTIIVTLPPQFEFDTGSGLVAATGSNISNESISVGLNTLTITYDVVGGSGPDEDKITVSGLKAKYLGSAENTYNALRTGGTGNMKGNNVVHGQPHFTFEVHDPPNPPTLSSTFWQADGSEDLLVPASVPSFTARATSDVSGTIRWYNDAMNLGTSITSASGASVPYNTLPNPSMGGFDISNADPALYTYYITADDATCESDPVKRNILVLSYLQNPGGFSYVDDAPNVTFTVSEPASHNVTTSGVGITSVVDDSGPPPTTTVTFSPSSVDAGDYPIEIITTNTLTNESVALPRELSVTATAEIFTPGTKLDVDYCEAEDVLTFDAKIDDINERGQLFYAFALDGVIIDPPAGWQANAGYPGELSNPYQDWELDLSTVEPGNHAIQRLVVDSTSTNPAADYILFLEADLDIYPTPTVEINDLPDFFCKDGVAIDLQATITNTDLGSIESSSIVNVTSYTILKLTGDNAGATNTITTGGTAATFDPADPIGDGTPPVGTYRITFTSVDTDDTNFPSAVDGIGCIASDIREIEVLDIPDLPTFSNNFSGMGSESLDGDTLRLQYCVGDMIPDIVANISSNDEITWYTNSSLTTTYNTVGSQGSTLEAAEVFGTNTPNSAFDVNIYVTKTDYINADGLGFVGCESEPKVVNIRVYNDPSVPAIDVSSPAASQLNASSYLFEYCDNYGSDNVSFTSVLPDSEAYYKLYAEDTTYIDLLESSSFEFFDDIGFSGPAGTDTTIYISRVLNDSTHVDSGGEFMGCESSLIELTINVYKISDSPDETLFATGRTDYYICSGEPLGAITSPGEQNTRYAWYVDNGDGTGPDYGNRIDVAAFDDRFAVQSEFELAGFTNENMTGSDTTFTYWVTQFQDYNDVTGYLGCESDPTELTITVFPDPGPPTFTDPTLSNVSLNASEKQFIEIAYCEENIEGVELTLNGNTDAVFNWYRADQSDSSIVGNAVHTHVASVPVTASQLKITDAEESDGVIYFVVTQTNDIEPNGADFDGCETEEDEMAFVTVYVYDVPLPPSTPGDIFTYCEDDVITNGITLEGEGGSPLFRWYRVIDGVAETTPFHTGSTADAATLELEGALGIDNYQFQVTQANNIGDGVGTFEGCESNPRLITVYEVPNAPTVLSFDDNTCVDELSGPIEISVEGQDGAVYNWYDGDNNLFRSQSTKNFNSGVDSVGTYTFYVSQTYHIGSVSGGCESPLDTVVFTINPDPVIPEFDLASNGSIVDEDFEFIYCKGEDISDESLFISNAVPGGEYYWYLSDSDPGTNRLSIQGGADEFADSISFSNLGIDIDVSGTYERYVILKIGECYSEFQEFKIIIGDAPEVSFTWEGLTRDNPTTFTLFNENEIVQDNEIQEVRLVVNDNEIPAFSLSGGGTFTNEVTFDHTFSAAGVYNVSLFMRTSEVCLDSVRRQVRMLDILSVDENNGYLQDFESSDGGWFAEYRLNNGKDDGRISSWEWGPPGNTIISNAFSGNNAWVTNLTGDYEGSEQSWVYSPAFDISNLEIPIISFQHQHWLFNNRDGVVFQYSQDNGRTWKQLGSVTDIGGLLESSGKNWYTHFEINSSPGVYKINDESINQEFNEIRNTGGSIQSFSYGWADVQSDELDPVGEWLLSINKMDEADTVIFRFAMATSAGDNDEGFAFDNFRIYDSDKITLLETFINATEDGAVDAVQDINGIVRQQSTGSIGWITYLTDLDLSSTSTRDAINRSNSVDPSARVGYYGINEVPKSALEGEVQELETGNQTLNVRGFTSEALGVAGLESKKFEIDLVLNDTDPEILSVTGTFTAVEDFSNNDSLQISIRFMVIEKLITGVEIGNFSTSDTLRNVLRKILPNPAGIVKSGPINQGQSFTETMEWRISNVYDPTQLDVIAFVQNENAVSGRKEVYQAAFLPTDVQTQDEIASKSLVLSVLDQLINGDPFVIYPNPADEYTNLEILKPVKDDLEWKLFDQTGKELQRGTLNAGEVSTEINTEHLPSGLFMLQLYHNNDLIEPKRIMVIHE